MNKSILDSIQAELIVAFKDQFKLNDETVKSLSRIGQNSLISTLKQFVMTKGTGEIEEILLKKKNFNGSGLQSQVQSKLEAAFQTEANIQAEQSREIAGFSSSFLVEKLVAGFQSSSSAKNLDGICEFLGIDKNLLKMVNSPVGKILGKFF